MFIGTTNSRSQAIQLAERMFEAGILHGDRVEVEILPFIEFSEPNEFSRLEPGSPTNGLIAHFCNTDELEGIRTIEAGDGQPLPTGRVVVEGIEVPKPGFYDLLNVQLYSNGQLFVIGTPETRVVPAVDRRDLSSLLDNDFDLF